MTAKVRNPYQKKIDGVGRSLTLLLLDFIVVLFYYVTHIASASLFFENSFID